MVEDSGSGNIFVTFHRKSDGKEVYICKRSDQLCNRAGDSVEMT